MLGTHDTQHTPMITHTWKAPHTMQCRNETSTFRLNAEKLEFTKIIHAVSMLIRYPLILEFKISHDHRGGIGAGPTQTIKLYVIHIFVILTFLIGITHCSTIY